MGDFQNSGKIPFSNLSAILRLDIVVFEEFPNELLLLLEVCRVLLACWIHPRSETRKLERKNNREKSEEKNGKNRKIINRAKRFEQSADFPAKN